MKKTDIIILSFFLLTVMVFSACELKRSNPLDPNGNSNVTVPDRVVGLTASGSGPGVQTKYVELKWKKNQTNTDGYYIYMGLAFDSAYELWGQIGNVSPDSIVTFRKSSSLTEPITPAWYYFKVSAYKNYGNKRLEGSLSEYAITHVDN